MDSGTRPPARDRDLDVAVHDRGATRFIEVSGDLDVAGCPFLEVTLAYAFRAGFERIVLGLDGVSFVDSAGVRCVFDNVARARGSGVQLVVIRPSGGPAAAFSLADHAGEIEFVERSAVRDGD